MALVVKNPSANARDIRDAGLISGLGRSPEGSSLVQFSSVAQSCPTLGDPMNCSRPGLPIHHQLPEFTQTHVHRVSDAIQPSHPNARRGWQAHLCPRRDRGAPPAHLAARRAEEGPGRPRAGRGPCGHVGPGRARVTHFPEPSGQCERSAGLLLTLRRWAGR